ncbi:MAG: hypothetical protein ACPGOV_14415 [Magnetovibrionaceae bacterium]
MALRTLILVAVLLAGSSAEAWERRFDATSDLTGHVFTVRGIAGPEGALVVLRIEDGSSENYASRANVEREVAPGPFRLRLALDDLHRSNGHRLEPSDIRFIEVFAARGEIAVDETETYPRLPRGPSAPVHAWDLGGGRSARAPGFNRADENDPIIVSGRPKPILRSLDDPLLRDGLGGVERLVLPLPEGQWRLLLWIGDRGAWQTRTYPKERRIKVNGEVRLLERRDLETWTRDIYLAGRDLEPSDRGSAWPSLERPGDAPLVVEAISDGGGITLDFAGDSNAATFIAGLLAHPLGSGAGAAVEARKDRRAWRREGWVIEQAPAALATERLHIDLVPGGSGEIRTALKLGEGRKPLVEAPGREGRRLPVVVRTGQWRLTRTPPQGRRLIQAASHLRADETWLDRVPLRDRPVSLLVSVPQGTPPGRYRGLISDGQGRERAFSVRVLDLALPRPAQAIGVYLDLAPHLAPHLTDRADHPDLGEMQAACDLDVLERLGLTAVAPPLPNPDVVGVEAYVTALGRLSRFDHVLDYANPKRIKARLGIGGVVDILRQVEKAAADRGLQSPYWSIADEPGNAGSRHDPAPLADAIRNSISQNAKKPRLAGHLNRPRDGRLLAGLDLGLINAGFGADVSDIELTKETGAQVWLYNMARPRLAAGFYLWRSGAQGYLQWHARMPSADPFDPTDGREADLQYLPPMAEICAFQPDLDAGLMALIDGILDLRWLLWLERKAAKDARAARLLADLAGHIPGHWEEARGLSNQKLDELRRRIADFAAQGLARRLN